MFLKQCHFSLFFLAREPFLRWSTSLLTLFNNLDVKCLSHCDGFILSLANISRLTLHLKQDLSLRIVALKSIFWITVPSSHWPPFFGIVIVMFKLRFLCRIIFLRSLIHVVVVKLSKLCVIRDSSSVGTQKSQDSVGSCK